MPDQFFDTQQPLDFDDYANQLLEQGLLESPSKLHGGICGLLVVGNEREPDHCNQGHLGEAPPFRTHHEHDQHPGHQQEEPEVDYFQDMTPAYRKAAKVCVTSVLTVTSLY